MATISWNKFYPDSRANRLKKTHVQAHGGGEALLLRCAAEIVQGVEWAAPGAAKSASFKDPAQDEWTHARTYAGGVPESVNAVIELLTEHLTLTRIDGIDLAHALDWYKEEDPAGELVATGTGRRINYTKHAKYPFGSSSQQARRELWGQMRDFVDAHPALARADVITAPPGHLADGSSYAESLAAWLADALGKRYVGMTGAGPRAEQKDSDARTLTDVFEMEETIEGTVLVIDDVCHSGATLAAAAAACRRAGADTVFAFVAARALRR